MYKVIFSSQREEKVSEKGFATDSCICLLVFPFPFFPRLLVKMNLKPLPGRTEAIPDCRRGGNRTGTRLMQLVSSLPAGAMH